MLSVRGRRGEDLKDEEITVGFGVSSCWAGFESFWGSRNLPFLDARKQLSGLNANIPIPILGFALSAAGLTQCKEAGTGEMSSEMGEERKHFTEQAWVGQVCRLEQ